MRKNTEKHKNNKRLTTKMEIAYMLINTRHGKLKIASSGLQKLEEVEEIHEIYGRFDIIAKVVCNDKQELRGFIQNKIQILEGIKSSEILLATDVED